MSSQPNEYANDMEASWGWIEDPTLPVSPIQALMEAAPHDDPRESKEELQEFRHAVADVFNAISAQHVYLINAYNNERLSYSELATRTGVSKSQAERDHKKAYAAVMPRLRAHPTIRERYATLQPTTWDQAAADAIYYIDVLSHNTLVAPVDHLIARAKEILYDGWEESGGEITELLINIGVAAYVTLALDDPEDLIKLLIDRHRKYGVGNILEFREYGLLVRMSDKNARIKNDAGDFADESTIDAWMDLVGYAAIASMLQNNTFLLPLAENNEGEA